MAKIKSEYTCSLILVNDLIGGKWKQRILWHILNGDNRFSLLQKGIPDITHKMLITQLNELQESGILEKTYLDDVRPHTNYAITDKYLEIVNILGQLCDFANKYADENNISLSTKNIVD